MTGSGSTPKPSPWRLDTAATSAPGDAAQPHHCRHSAAAAAPSPDATVDELIVVPGLVYRSDSIDRTHAREPTRSTCGGSPPRSAWGRMT